MTHGGDAPSDAHAVAAVRVRLLERLQLACRADERAAIQAALATLESARPASPSATDSSAPAADVSGARLPR